MQKRINPTTPEIPAHLPKLEHEGNQPSHSRKTRAARSSPHGSEPSTLRAPDRLESSSPDQHGTPPAHMQVQTDPSSDQAKTERSYVIGFDVGSLSEIALAQIRLTAQEPSTLSPQIDEIVFAIFQGEYLRGPLTKRSAWKQVWAHCEVLKIKPPSYASVASRFDTLISKEVLRVNFPH